MTNFHGAHMKSSFFEGWYLKHQNEQDTIAVIPSYHVHEDGDKVAKIQVITNEKTYLFDFPANQFKVSKNKFLTKIGENIFCEKGMKLNLQSEEVCIQGAVKYGRFHPLQRDIMGPFRMIPRMQCNHGVLSLFHNVTGSISINDKKVDFDKGIGYIEKDWGRSFPTAYLWTQCNAFPLPECCAMVSVASIPLPGLQFKGCIGIVYTEGREYRFATYQGVKIIKCTSDELLIRQGKYSLHVQLLEKHELPLQAPKYGEMSRIIKENPSCRVRYHFCRKKQTVFDWTSDRAGFEWEGAEERIP